MIFKSDSFQFKINNLINLKITYQLLTSNIFYIKACLRLLFYIVFQNELNKTYLFELEIKSWGINQNRNRFDISPKKFSLLFLKIYTYIWKVLHKLLTILYWWMDPYNLQYINICKQYVCMQVLYIVKTKLFYRIILEKNLKILYCNYILMYIIFYINHNLPKRQNKI